ncbi:diacylglycerol kinase family protein [Paenibacillus koleovorans]|uniref:diacylglycerol kinase family protein n=1 Tax=Paenibacillus koleovorans TaxID=121608 RepID=UPI000FDAEB5E|nr:diacylglycerol kinase family protein [Paenibacillus koleovorans]
MRDVKRFRRSFRYAYEGLHYALSTQQNMQFHFSVGLIALILALVFKLPKVEVLFLLLAITLVIVTELINTAVEKAVDLAMPDLHPLAKIAKDVAAASVLVSAVFAAVTGMIVFYEPIDRLLRKGELLGGGAVTPGLVWTLIALIAMLAIVLQSRFSHKHAARPIKPSLLAAVACSLSTWVTLLTSQSLIALLGFALTILMLYILYDGKRTGLLSLLAGALLGSGLTAAVFTWIHTFS